MQELFKFSLSLPVFSEYRKVFRKLTSFANLWNNISAKLTPPPSIPSNFSLSEDFQNVTKGKGKMKKNLQIFFDAVSNQKYFENHILKVQVSEFCIIFLKLELKDRRKTQIFLTYTITIILNFVALQYVISIKRFVWRKKGSNIQPCLINYKAG